MKRTNRLLLIFGVILAAASFLAVLAFGSHAPKAPEDPSVPVVVAAQNLGLGTTVTPEMLTTVQWEKSDADAAGAYEHPEELIGQVVRRGVAQGAALTGDDFTSGVSVPELVRSLSPGLRAMALPLSKVDSVGMLLQPGDYVDVLLTIDDPDALNPAVIPNPNSGSAGGEGEAPYISIDQFVNNTTVKIVVQNVQVLAALPKEPDQGTTTTAGQPVVEPDLIAILAVQPQHVEVLRFAQLDGHVSLVLRSPSDYAAGQVTTTGITLWELVNRWGVLPPQPIIQP